MSQLIIALFGVPSVFLSQCNNIEYRKWAPIIAMIAQPFWFIETFKAEQYGMFCLCFLYTGSWLYGFYNYWIKK